MGDRASHPENCACCIAYDSSIALFKEAHPDGQIDLFIDGLLQGVAHIAANQCIENKIVEEREVLQSRVAMFFDFYCAELGMVTKQ